MKKERKHMDFNSKYHFIGMAWMFVALCMFISIPVTIAVYYGAKPNWAVLGCMAVVPLLIINTVSGFGEPIIYAPMLGISGEYIAFITGNLSNLKIPCVVKCHEIYEAKQGSEEYEVISMAAIAASTIVTTVLIAIMVVILAASSKAIDSLRANEWVTPAFTCVVYALFGSLGGKYVVENPKFALIPGVAIIVLSIILGFVGINPGSSYLLIGIGVCAVFALFQIFRQRKKKKAQKDMEHYAEVGNTEHELLPVEEEHEETIVSDEITQNDDDDSVATVNNDGQNEDL